MGVNGVEYSGWLMTSGPLEKSVMAVASAHPEVEFALVLARTIDAVQADPEQLRSAVYDLARHKLDQLAHDDPAEKGRLMQALEVAIAGVESHTQNNPIGPAMFGPQAPQARRIDTLIAGPGKDGLISEEPPSWSVTQIAQAPILVSDPGRAKAKPAKVFLHLALPILFIGLVGVIVLQRRGRSLQHVATEAAPVIQPAPPPVVAKPPPEPERKVDPLVPTAYGVYAVSSDKLFELQSLQGRVPDPRVAISAAITKPSETSLPDGKVRFVVFRRDPPANEASDPPELRVVAEVKQATNFDATGKPIVSSEQSWVIRNISIPYHAAPMKDQPGMYQVLPRDPDFVLSPGRYALTLNGIGFDFAIQGKITDKKQCLERLVAANGTFYSECLRP